jgi:hypothetical protein
MKNVTLQNIRPEGKQCRKTIKLMELKYKRPQSRMAKTKVQNVTLI